MTVHSDFFSTLLVFVLLSCLPTRAGVRTALRCFHVRVFFSRCVKNSDLFLCLVQSYYFPFSHVALITSFLPPEAPTSPFFVLIIAVLHICKSQVHVSFSFSPSPSLFFGGVLGLQHELLVEAAPAA